MSVKITSFEAENVKRIKAVQLTPTENGLTVIGGRNNQGKTSVLDAIAWALGGNRLKPSNAHRDGSVMDPEIKIQLSNGLVVERKGKNSELKITDPTGKKAGQSILDSLIGEMALNIPKFMDLNSKDKARRMLQIAGVDDQLAAIDKEKAEVASERLYVGRQARTAEENLTNMQRFPDSGTELWSASQLIEQQQAILMKNAENGRKRAALQENENRLNQLNAQIQQAESELAQLKSGRLQLMTDIEIGRKNALDLYDESTDELEKNINMVDLHNQQVRDNLAFESEKKKAEELRAKFKELNAKALELDQSRLSLLQNANLPLEGLSVDETGELIYKGQKWDGMSSSDQMRVSTAICQAMNPQCGFVLLDKLEQMDQQTMNEFGQWLETQGLQAIATRVSTGDECSVIIEDGRVKGETTNDSTGPNQNSDLGTAWSW